MKIKPEHLATLKERVTLHDTEERREQYRTGQFPRADKVKDLNMRYRWDLFWYSKVMVNNDMGLYSYLNDEHIDTALRSFIKPL